MVRVFKFLVWYYDLMIGTIKPFTRLVTFKNSECLRSFIRMRPVKVSLR